MNLVNKILLTTIIVLITSSFMVGAEEEKKVVTNGEKIYINLGCIGCHGVHGKSVIPIYPSLKGQHAIYTIKQLKDFQSGVRKDPTMNAMAPLVIGYEKDIADYLASK